MLLPCAHTSACKYSIYENKVLVIIKTQTDLPDGGACEWCLYQAASTRKRNKAENQHMLCPCSPFPDSGVSGMQLDSVNTSLLIKQTLHMKQIYHMMNIAIRGQLSQQNNLLSSSGASGCQKDVEKAVSSEFRGLAPSITRIPPQ